MIFYFKKSFIKKFKKLSLKMQQKFNQSIVVFKDDPFNPLLNNHALHGKYAGSYSINITGDLRAVYKLQSDDVALFVDIDNHSNLYK